MFYARTLNKWKCCPPIGSDMVEYYTRNYTVIHHKSERGGCHESEQNVKIFYGLRYLRSLGWNENGGVWRVCQI